MDVLKLTYETEKLADIVEERNRLIQTVRISPSANDNEKLIQQVQKTYRLVNSLYDQCQKHALSQSDIESIRDCMVTYRRSINDVEEPSFDIRQYFFDKEFVDAPIVNSNVSGTEETGIQSREVKKVRFSDNAQENKPVSPEIQASDMHFKPYFDDNEEDTLSTSASSNGNGIDADVSNRELFIEQQQRLMTQDADIDTLATSVQRAHGISLDIHHEVEDQNVGLLTDLENMVDTSDRNLQRAKRRLEVFQRTARENGPCTTIILLIIILILLLVLL
ncbi:similar to Saccharomyces cerevisiae YAL014C SYN8 Endosomal SNARE related to mammalian syntaxin 8 [Maudiozyma saulgeensis]|uniref:Similar to Saccharomyces cerevisiae YAL014C SYN8 Endosomal SNARE related to mammalian syntaxin 8 n=1 Tax=Maudiozyma saulgeensis TaxID=1789683 RepID=A0A1X7R733_9SACH|nr:similar to Saccharomyces cerevisiae YAL014C SYN8 Endosomal SNARE related to mammalian syntaxin 8 [Kazachstania saulgeensis]